MCVCVCVCVCGGREIDRWELNEKERRMKITFALLSYMDSSIIGKGVLF